MSRESNDTIAWTEPGVGKYLTVGLIALGVIGIVMLQRTSGIIAFIPVLAGLAGALSGFGPILLVLSVVVCLNAPAYVEPATSRRMILDALLGAAVLAYVISYYRLQSLLVHVFPPDPRQRSEPEPRSGVLWFLPRRPRVKRQRRASELVTAAEIGGVLWAIPVWLILAQYVWIALPNESTYLRLPRPIWHAVILAWLIGLTWFVIFGFLGYLRDRRMTPDEAMVSLQDTLWTETRREQRRLNRWLAWQRRRSKDRGHP